jgi:hypothetical protein
LSEAPLSPEYVVVSPKAPQSPWSPKKICA